MIFGVEGMLTHLTGLSGTTLLLLLFVLSLALAFVGRKLVKVLAFIVAGLVIGSIAASLATAYLPSFGSLGALLGGVAGFVVGGFVGLTLVYLGIGIGIGYLGYYIASTLVSTELVSIIVGIVFFAVGVLLANRILSVATALLGGILLYEVLGAFGIGFIVSAALAIGVGVLGVWVQSMERSGYSQKAPPIQSQSAA